MVLGYHLIFSAYGFWLPNDPRGSWSDFVRSWELYQYGPATRVGTHRSLADMPHNVSLRLAAKQTLHYPPVTFNAEQTPVIAHGMAHAAQEGNYIIHACAILPAHVHLVLARHERPIGQISAHIKGRATQALQNAGLHPLAGYQDGQGKCPSPWAQKGWKVFLDSGFDLVRAIKYVEQNPPKEGKPMQRWAFVVPYRE